MRARQDLASQFLALKDRVRRLEIQRDETGGGEPNWTELTTSWGVVKQYMGGVQSFQAGALNDILYFRGYLYISSPDVSVDIVGPGNMPSEFVPHDSRSTIIHTWDIGRRARLTLTPGARLIVATVAGQPSPPTNLQDQYIYLDSVTFPISGI